MAQRDLLPADTILPNKLLIVSLSGKPVFPGIFIPLMITSDVDISLVDQATSTNNLIGLNLLKVTESGNGDSENPVAEDLFKVGTVAKIVKKINLPDGGYNIFISTLIRL